MQSACMRSLYLLCIKDIICEAKRLDTEKGRWHNRHCFPWRCRGPGGSHRLQNGWGVARRGPWWVRLPYASASCLSMECHDVSFYPWFCRCCKTVLPFRPCKTMLPFDPLERPSSTEELRASGIRTRSRPAVSLRESAH